MQAWQNEGSLLYHCSESIILPQTRRHTMGAPVLGCHYGLDVDTEFFCSILKIAFGSSEEG